MGRAPDEKVAEYRAPVRPVYPLGWVETRVSAGARAASSGPLSCLAHARPEQRAELGDARVAAAVDRLHLVRRVERGADERPCFGRRDRVEPGLAGQRVGERPRQAEELDGAAQV